MESQGKTTQELQKSIQQFAVKYGLLGLMTALPTTSGFMDYEAVYLPKMSLEQRQLMQQGMQAFGGIAPTYRIALLDKPTIVWDFHSLMLGIQMMFSFMLTDVEKPVRICRHCLQAFVARRPSAVFCSPQCKNKYNVYKSRTKKNNPKREGQTDD